MPKDKKNKNNVIERLHEILDNNILNGKKSKNDEEKYYKDLKERLRQQKAKNLRYKTATYKVAEGEKTLEPKITVYPRGKQKVEISKIKTKIELSKTEITFEQKDIFEVEKIDSKEPEFLEVKPKIEDTKESEKSQPEPELKEWEAVGESEKNTDLIDFEEKKEITEQIICIGCGARIDKGAVFCHVCGESQKEEDISKKPEKKISEEEEILSNWEPVEDDIGEWEEAESLDLKQEKKQEVAKENKDLKNDIGEWEETEFVKIEPDKDMEKTNKPSIEEKIEEEIEKDLEQEVKKETELEEQNWDQISKTEEWVFEKEEKFCPECGELLDSEDKFCKNCGEKVYIKDLKEDIKIQEVLITADTEKLSEEEKISEEEINNIFKDYSSIEDETAKILFNNGFTSIESLKEVNYRELKKIKGIKRKTAKNIINEINQKIQEDVEIKPIEIKETAEKEISEEEILKEEKEDENEWVIEEEDIDNKIKKDEEEKIEENRKELFIDLESIDEETAKILYNKGYKSSEDLLKSEIAEIKKIKGIKKKKIKDIIKEIDKKSSWDTIDDSIEITVKEEPKGKQEKDIINDEDKLNIFKDVTKIDEKTAIQLYDSGYTSIDSIRNSSVEEINEKTGLKNREIKKIHKEINKILKSYDNKDHDKLTDTDFSEYFIDEEIEDDAKEIDEKIKDFEENNKDIKESFEIKEKSSEDEKSDLKKKYFNDIDCVDEKIAELLILAGYDSIEKIREAKISELIKIKGIRRKIAKKLKKEVNNIPKIKDNSDEEWETFEDKSSDKNYTKKGYTLYKKEISTKSGSKRTVHFFSKEEKDEAKPEKLPKGYIVKVNKKTGVPYLKKKKK